MTPRFASDNSVSRAFGDAKFVGDSAERPTVGIQRSQLFHFFLRQLSRSCLLSAREAFRHTARPVLITALLLGVLFVDSIPTCAAHCFAVSVTVSGIVFVVSIVEVRWVHAVPGTVAAVENRVFRFAVLQGEGVDVRSHGLPTRREPKLAVTVGMQATYPMPALFGLSNVGPEAFCITGRRSFRSSHSLAIVRQLSVRSSYDHC